MTNSTPARVVVVGAGFSGLYAAKLLAKTTRGSVDITIINPSDTFLFAPRLIDALADDRHRSAACIPLPDHAKEWGVHFLHGRATAVDRSTKRITFVPQDGSPATDLPYDVVAVCAGAKPAYRNIPGAEEFSLPLKAIEDVDRLHERLRERCEEAMARDKDPERRALLSFITVGAGPSGIEALSALKQYAEALCRKKYPDLLPLLTFGVIQAGPQILPGFPITMVTGIIEELERQGIFIYLGDPVTRITADAIETAQGRRIPAGIIMWAAGIEPQPLDVTPPIQHDKNGNIAVDRTLRVDPSFFAAGDIVLYREENVIVPKNAQTAMLMAETLAGNILRSLRHETLVPFHYFSRGNILVVGDTGFLDFRIGTLKTSLAPRIRNLFYAYRSWQIARSW